MNSDKLMNSKQNEFHDQPTVYGQVHQPNDEAGSYSPAQRINTSNLKIGDDGEINSLSTTQLIAMEEKERLQKGETEVKLSNNF